MNSLLIILLVIFSVLFFCVILIFFKVRNKLREFSKTAFGTEDIIKGIKNQELETISETKTLTGMDKLDLPR